MTAPALAATAAATPIRVLFVDDEANVLQGLQRSLRSLRHAWEMTFVVGGAAAIAELERRPFDVVVTDMRMPGSDGAEVLGAASRLHPEALRIVLSGQAPREVLTRASIHAHQFLWKPCATEVLTATVHDALALRRDLSAPGLGRLVAEVGGLPTLEPRLRALMTELARAEVDLAAVSNVVGQDLGLSTRVLRIANSALYSLGSPPASVRHAVELLGTQSLAAMLASLGVIERFPVELADDAAAMQLHATRSSSFAHNAVTALGLPMRPDVAFTAGLLHDIGAWHLLSRRPEPFVAARARIAAGEAVEAVETEVFGATHAQLGALMLADWGFPHEVARGVANHHRHPIARRSAVHAGDLVRLADHYVPLGSHQPPTDPSPDLELLGLAAHHDRLLELAARAFATGAP